MKLTEEQRAAVEHCGNVVITACPGSGKTRTIIAKILKCVDEIRDTPRKIACITYTNTAVYEIENRVSQNQGGVEEGICEVSTIHSFCQSNILTPYYWKTEDYKEGFTILTSDSDQFNEIATEIIEEFGLDNSSFTLDSFGGLHRNPDGSPGTSGNVTTEAALAFWNRIKKDGLIDFGNIIYQSYLILSQNPSLVENLSCRFAYLLVDEFQDTTALQVEILKFISSENRTDFFLVGDREQSIFSFAGAQSGLMEEFAEFISAEKFPILGNFRSTKPLVEVAERLIEREPPMRSVTVSESLPFSFTYQHTENPFVAITDFLLPYLEENDIPLGDAAILAPNWYILNALGRKLREYGVPIVGPGARPYKRSYALGRIAEQVCGYLETGTANFLRQTEKELALIANQSNRGAMFRLFSYEGQRIVQRLMFEGRKIQSEHEGGREWLRKAAESFERILLEERILAENQRGQVMESAELMLKEMEQAKVDLNNLNLSDLGMFADPRKNIKLMTMHTAKGREFPAVAIVGLIDGQVPYHNYYNSLTKEGIEEGRRLFYVSLTRAEKALMVFSNDHVKGLPPSRYLNELGVID